MLSSFIKYPLYNFSASLNENSPTRSIDLQLLGCPFSNASPSVFAHAPRASCSTEAITPTISLKISYPFQTAKNDRTHYQKCLSATLILPQALVAYYHASKEKVMSILFFYCSDIFVLWEWKDIVLSFLHHFEVQLIFK